MTEFNVGDKVRIVKNPLAVKTGTKGTVTEVPAKTGGMYTVSGAGYPYFLAEEMELVKPEPKFKVGDWVKVQGRGDKWDGTVGTVQKIKGRDFGSYGNLYVIHKDDTPAGKDHVLSFFEGQLVATEAPAPVFKKGDIVANKPGTFVYEAHKGKTLIVEAANGPERGYKYAVRALGEEFLSGHEYKDGELIPGEPLAQWEIELLDLKQQMVADLAKAKAAHPSNGKGEAVEHPAHYGGDTTYEVIKVAEAWGLDKDAYLFNVLKYIARAGKKGSKLEDLKKGGFYLNRRIKQEEAK